MNTLQKAIAKRDEFLAEHPHLKEYQREIDEVLDKTPEHERAHVLGILMSSKLFELQNALLNLTEAVGKE